MKSLIKKLLRENLFESMDNELIGNININIPFNKLVIDKVNLGWAIENIKENRPSRSSNKPMQVAMGIDNKYYLLDGYHRLVEAVINGKTSTKGILLNKSFEELKSMNKIGVGCAGGAGDKFCSNFKNLGSVEMIKNSFNQIKEQMIDGQNMNHDEQNFCNQMSVPPTWLEKNSYKSVVKFLNQMLGSKYGENKEIWQKIQAPLKDWSHQEKSIDNQVKTGHMSGDSMPDEGNTDWTKIQSTVCEQGPDGQ